METTISLHCCSKDYRVCNLDETLVCDRAVHQDRKFETKRDTNLLSTTKTRASSAENFSPYSHGRMTERALSESTVQFDIELARVEAKIYMDKAILIIY